MSWATSSSIAVSSRASTATRESVYSGVDTIRVIEREADDFASNLLMPGDLRATGSRTSASTQHVLSAILAKRFQVSFEALCIRFIKFTTQRAIPCLFGQRLREVRMAQQQRRQDARAHSGAIDPQEPLPGTPGCRFPPSSRNGMARRCPPRSGARRRHHT